MREVTVVFPASLQPSQEEFRRAVAASAGIPPQRLTDFRILKRSLDARAAGMKYHYRILAAVDGETVPQMQSLLVARDVSQAPPVVVVGTGPAGLFAALRLIAGGRKPLLLERGRDVHGRKYDIAAISRRGELCEDSNYCYGEGGAGTFSDGKLYTRSNKRGDVSSVLRTFVDCGADPWIMADAHPHIGSDRLPAIVETMRQHITGCGGEYHFSCRVTDLQRMPSGGWKVCCKGSEGTADQVFEAPQVVLATGHSASDIYRLFLQKGWAVEAKGFAMGVRAEHPQSLIDHARYHGSRPAYLPAAEYSLVEQVDGRGVFSFCMCPGGILVPSSTTAGTVVTNGMSNSSRNSRWANAGIVTSVEPEDVMEYYAAEGVSHRSTAEAMLAFRHDIESRCWSVSSSYRAPAQRMTDFVKSSREKSVVTPLPQTSYQPGTVATDLTDVLPEFVASRLQKAFPAFDKKLRGYYTSQSLLLAVESRTSSPVRLVRDPDTLQHISAPGLYPCGEGAGYSGGIVSSAMDGIRAADEILKL